MRSRHRPRLWVGVAVAVIGLYLVYLGLVSLGLSPRVVAGRGTSAATQVELFGSFLVCTSIRAMRPDCPRRTTCSWISAFVRHIIGTYPCRRVLSDTPLVQRRRGRALIDAARFPFRKTTTADSSPRY